MNDLTLDKLQYLIEGLTGRQVGREVLKALTDNDISLKSFQKTCMTKADIPLPPDPRSKKYEGITLYSEKMFVELARQKFPEGVEANLYAWLADVVKDCIVNGFSAGFRDYPANLNLVNDNPKYMDVRFKMCPDEYHRIWPSSDIYMDEEMDEWIEDTYGTNDEENMYRSTLTNMVRRFPDLTGGSIYFLEEDRAFHHRLTIEGRPFYEAVSVLLQKPDITTDELKELLHDEQKMQQFLVQMKGKAKDGKAEFRIAGTDVIAFEYGKLGYMAVDRRRRLDEYGEPLDNKMRIAFQSIVENRQFIDKDNRIFFYDDPQMKDQVSDYYINAEDGEILNVKDYKLWDGETIHVHADDKKAIDQSVWTGFIRLKDRITDVNVSFVNKDTIYEHIKVRCRIDGEQQPFVELPKNIEHIYNKYTSTQEDTLLAFLAKQYKDLLCNPKHERIETNGLKR